jgi:hypothetical protein
MGTTPNVMRPDRFNLNELIAFIFGVIDAPGWMAEIGCYQGESTEAFARNGVMMYTIPTIKPQCIAIWLLWKKRLTNVCARLGGCL